MAHTKTFRVNFDDTHYIPSSADCLAFSSYYIQSLITSHHHLCRQPSPMHHFLTFGLLCNSLLTGLLAVLLIPLHSLIERPGWFSCKGLRSHHCFPTSPLVPFIKPSSRFRIEAGYNLYPSSLSPQLHFLLLPLCPSFSIKQTQTQTMGTFLSEAGLCTQICCLRPSPTRIFMTTVSHPSCLDPKMPSQRDLLFTSKKVTPSPPCHGPLLCFIFLMLALFTHYIYSMFIVCPG